MFDKLRLRLFGNTLFGKSSLFLFILVVLGMVSYRISVFG